MAGLLDRKETERAIKKAILSNGFSDFLAEKIARDMRVDQRLQRAIGTAVAQTSTMQRQMRKPGFVERYRRLSIEQRRVIIEDVKDEIRHHICDLVCHRLTELLNSNNAITKMINLRIQYKTKEYYDRHLTPEKIMSLLPIASNHESHDAPDALSESESESEADTDDNIYGEPWKFIRVPLTGIPSVLEPMDFEAGEVQEHDVESQGLGKGEEEAHEGQPMTHCDLTVMTGDD